VISRSVNSSLRALGLALFSVFPFFRSSTLIINEQLKMSRGAEEFRPGPKWKANEVWA